MKRFPTVALLLAALLPTCAFAADFEGVIQMSMTTGSHTTPMTFTEKPGFTRIDMAAAGGRVGGMIMDHAKQEMTILMPQQRMYMVQAIPQQVIAQAQSKIDDAAVEKTNDHEKILGYDTTKYIAKNNEGTSDIWVTDQLGTFAGFGPAQGGGLFGRGAHSSSAKKNSWEDAFKGKEAFPLRVITTNSSGQQTFKMEATSVEKKSVPASEFQPPADYRKFDMGAMMRGMGGLPGMAAPQGGSEH